MWIACRCIDLTVITCVAEVVPDTHPLPVKGFVVAAPVKSAWSVAYYVISSDVMRRKLSLDCIINIISNRPLTRMPARGPGRKAWDQCLN